MLNPIFSIAHMRHMMPIFYDVGHKVRPPMVPGPPFASLLTAARFCPPTCARRACSSVSLSRSVSVLRLRKLTC